MPGRRTVLAGAAGLAARRGAAPDGLNLILGGGSDSISLPAFRDLPYDPKRSFRTPRGARRAPSRTPPQARLRCCAATVVFSTRGFVPPQETAPQSQVSTVRSLAACSIAALGSSASMVRCSGAACVLPMYRPPWSSTQVAGE